MRDAVAATGGLECRAGDLTASHLGDVIVPDCTKGARLGATDLAFRLRNVANDHVAEFRIILGLPRAFDRSGLG